MTHSLQILIFSKDRACQLEACLRSLLTSMDGNVAHRISVLYKSSDAFHKEQYDQLKREYQGVDFILESDFQNGFWKILEGSEYVFFAVDDTIFIDAFSLDEICSSLAQHPDVVGFSLRLGKSITYCYPLQCSQRQPVFRKEGSSIVSYDWTQSEYDFGYPLEVSSSVYRTTDIFNVMKAVPFANPNVFEGELSKLTHFFDLEKPRILCYENPVAFACPVNLTQNVNSNLHGLEFGRKASEFALDFAKGLRIDLAFTQGFLPTSCHQEVDLQLVDKRVI